MLLFAVSIHACVNIWWFDQNIEALAYSVHGPAMENSAYWNYCNCTVDASALQPGEILNDKYMCRSNWPPNMNPTTTPMKPFIQHDRSLLLVFRQKFVKQFKVSPTLLILFCWWMQILTFEFHIIVISHNHKNITSPHSLVYILLKFKWLVMASLQHVETMICTQLD